MRVYFRLCHIIVHTQYSCNLVMYVLQLGNQGETSLNGIIGYAFEAEGHISGCTNGQPAVTVCTAIEDQWPQAYTNLSTWYRAEKTASCGFQVCFLILRKRHEFT